MPSENVTAVINLASSKCYNSYTDKKKCRMRRVYELMIPALVSLICFFSVNTILLLVFTNTLLLNYISYVSNMNVSLNQVQYGKCANEPDNVRCHSIILCWIPAHVCREEWEVRCSGSARTCPLPFRNTFHRHLNDGDVRGGNVMCMRKKKMKSSSEALESSGLLGKRRTMCNNPTNSFMVV